jgi:pimeloyl-ACP methyl ester carboxylesterase
MECHLENIAIHYETFGAGRPLVILHGWPLDHRYMVRAMEPIFSQRDGWQRIYPDLPGMGQTPGVDWLTTQDQMQDVVLDFMDAVIPGQRCVIAGTSYGGYLARGVVYRRAAQLDGLLLVVPVIKAVAAQRTLPSHVTLVQDPALLAELTPEMAESVQGLAVVQSRKFVESLQADIFPAVESADHPFLARLRQNYQFSFDVDALPEPFARPTLMLMARQDAVCGYRDAWDILENYPRASFVVLDRAGHGLEVEQEDMFRGLVNEWLDRVEEAARS